jgi:hypothetical protein
MSQRTVYVVSALGALFAGQAAAQGVTIDHKAVGCIVAGKHPKMNACFQPTGSLARQRIYFKAVDTNFWYFVEMKSDAPCFSGILPKPKKTIKAINYYVEAVDRSFQEARTSEYSPQVVEDEGECRKDVPAAPFVNSAQVVVGATAGAPVVPAGFLAAGLGAGIGTGTIVAGVVGAGAATAGVVAITGGGGGTTQPPPTNPPGTSGPPPPPPDTTSPPATNPPPPGLNGPPKGVFVISPDPAFGTAPLKVKFDMCGSSDPDGDPLTFKFAFGDGQSAQGGCSASHTYSKPTLAKLAGTLTATLRVTDGLPGHEQSRNFPIEATCPSPKVKVTSPKGSVTTGCNAVLIQADVTDPVGVDFVEFQVRDPRGGFTQNVGTDFNAPYQVTWNSYFAFGDFQFIATAFNTCGGSGQASVTAFLNCYGNVQSQANRLAITSDLAVPGGRGQLVLNEASLSFPGAGRSMAQGRTRRGENRIEAQLVEGTGPGTWRFELGGLPDYQPGSLRVLSGEAVTVGTDSIEFRLKGTPGERVSFTFRVN